MSFLFFLIDTEQQGNEPLLCVETRISGRSKKALDEFFYFFSHGLWNVYKRMSFLFFSFPSTS